MTRSNNQFDKSKQTTEETQKTHRARPHPKSLLRLYCTIYVETESQKPIIIGRGGSMITS